MLYDNAQLLGLYARAYEHTESELLRLTALRTAHYLRAEMQAPRGGFYSAQDAEVDGVEGASYSWTKEEIESVLGVDDAEFFFELYTLVPMPKAPYGHEQPAGGVLRVRKDLAEMDDPLLTQALQLQEPSRRKLFAVREKRDQPARDEKIVIADNALTIIAFSQAGQSLDDPSLSKTAEKAANWIWKKAFDSKTGELKHLVYKGQLGGPGFLDDYALLGQAFMSLYHNSGKKRWYSRAQKLTDSMLKRFARPDGVLLASWDSVDLVVAPPEQGDSVKPSGQSSAIALLLDLAVATGEQAYAMAAYRALLPLYTNITANPASWGSMLVGLSQPKTLSALQLAANSDSTLNRPASLDSAAYVHARASWSTRAGAPELAMTIKIDHGYHINANPASESFLIATELIVAGQPDIAVEYPQSQTFKAAFAPQGIDVFQGRIILKAKLPKPDSAKHPDLSLRVQACNEKVCLAPATIAVPANDKNPR